jgi:hypothetical protein
VPQRHTGSGLPVGSLRRPITNPWLAVCTCNTGVLVIRRKKLRNY